MTYPLSKKEKKFIENLHLRQNDDMVSFTQSEYQLYISFIEEMERRRILLRATSINDVDEKFYVCGDISSFAEYILSENAKVEAISRREWKIGILSAIIGAVTAFILSKVTS